MAALFLDDTEIADLTHKRRPKAQGEVLNSLGITHKVRPDGSLIVLRSHVERQLGGEVATPSKKDPVPNWGAIQ